MTTNAQFFDVCIVCPLAEEAEAVLEVISHRCRVVFEKGFNVSENYEYRYAIIQNHKEEPLPVHASWQPDKGPLETALHFKSVLKTFRPRFAAMTGICAGDRKKLKLGDLVIADRAFFYDTGKIVTDENGQLVYLHNVKTYNADPSVLQCVRLFHGWKPVVARLKRPRSLRQQREWLLSRLLENESSQLASIPLAEREKEAPDWRRIALELQEGPDEYLTETWTLRDKSKVEQLQYGRDPFPFRDPTRPEGYVAPMASGSAVRSDDPFQDVQIPVREAAAIDMEGAAFYRALEEFPDIRSLLVKGVSDYADREKDDTFHRYASRAAATYALCFIQEYVTEERMPRLHQLQPPRRGSPPYVWNVPYQRNPFFTGREDILQQLHDKITTTRAAALTQPQAVSGLGGIGKTEIALEYAYRYRNKYEYILWVRAATREVLLSDYGTLADLLHLPERNEQDQNRVVSAVKEWFATHDKWLLIFDNADDLAIVHDLLPSGGKGHMLLTTRAQAVGTIAQSIEIEKMGMVEGTLFLLRRTKILQGDAFLDQASEEHLSAAEAIVIAMDFLPLALDQAGAYIEETACSLSGYLDLYRTRRKELLQRRGTVPSHHPESVVTTWSLSFERIEQNNLAAAELLRLCAFLDPDAIPEELISKGSHHLGSVLQLAASDTLAFNEAIEELRRYSLLQRNPDSGILSLHRLVQDVLKDAMTQKKQRVWAERAVRLVHSVFPKVKVETWSLCQRYLPHAQICSQLIERYTLIFKEAADLLSRAAAYLFEHALYSIAESLYQQALPLYEQLLGPSHSTATTIIHNLAQTYDRLEKDEQAEAFYQRALALSEQRLGLSHPKSAGIIRHLAGFYSRRGKYQQAERLYQQALTIYEQQTSPMYPEVALTLNDFSVLCQEQGKYELAASFLERSIKICEQHFGPTSLETARSIHNLASILREEGKYEQAETLYQRALSIRQDLLGPTHLDTSVTQNNLAGLYKDQGKYQQAEEIYRHVLSVREHQLGPSHTMTATALNNLGLILVEQEKYKQAEPFYQQALAIYEQHLGSTHPLVALTLGNLASLYDNMGRYELAEPLHMRSIAIREECLGPMHPDTAASLSNLAGLYKDQGKYKQAEELYKCALAIYEHHFGPVHPHTARTLNNLAGLYERQGMDEEAEILYRKALEIYHQYFGSAHPTTQRVQNYYERITQRRRQGPNVPS